MKTKILLVLIFSLILCLKLTAQFSFTNVPNGMKKDKTAEIFSVEMKNSMAALAEKINSLETTAKSKLVENIKNSKNYEDVEKAIEESPLVANEKITLKSQTFDIVSKEREGMNAEGDRLIRLFFPARFNEYGGKVSTYFFEGREEYTQLFQNNNVVYNPNLKNLSFNSEVVNDYLGPLRVGIGFQFSSTVKNNDSIATSEEEKDKLVSSLQNGGGNLFINVKYPFISIGEDNGSFGLKSFLYHNSGVELTKVNESDDDFVLTNNTGIAIGAFGTGQKGKISAFVIAKAAILYGNSKYNKILSVEEDFKKVLPLFNIGVGINFSDMYTVKAEFYPAGNYIKRNFPATISFVIVPKK